MIGTDEVEAFRKKLAAVNEALLISAVRQHELREAAERTNKRLKEEIAERERAQEALREAAALLEQRVKDRTADLDRSNQDLQGFTHSVAHDLRSPLRTIISTSRLLQDEAGANLSAEHLAMLDRQAASASRLGHLIDDLLKFAQLSNHPYALKSVDLTEMARQLSSGLAEWFPERTLEFVVEDGLSAEGDASALRMVLQNLIENAAKFSPEGGTISVGRQPAGDQAFFVRDEGIGFDMRYSNKLFMPFERLVRDDDFPGTGIGLANVKRIVERHHGKVWAESEPGSGSTFFFTLHAALLF